MLKTADLQHFESYKLQRIASCNRVIFTGLTNIYVVSETFSI